MSAPRPRQFTPMQVLAHDVETAIAPLTGDAKAGAEMVLRYIRTLAAEIGGACPDHAGAETCYLDCQCAAARDLRRMADEAEKEATS